MTHTRSTALLQRLSGGVIPVEGATLTDTGFTDAISWARAQKPGGLTFSTHVDRASISDEVVELLTKATEDAARRGIGHAIVDIGGSLMRLDVHKRRVEAQIAPQTSVVEDGIDGYLRPWREDSEDQSNNEEDEETQEPRLIGPDPQRAPGPARVVRNVSLASTLAGPAA